MCHFMCVSVCSCACGCVWRKNSFNLTRKFLYAKFSISALMSLTDLHCCILCFQGVEDIHSKDPNMISSLNIALLKIHG